MQAQFLDNRYSLRLHISFDRTPFAVECIQSVRQGLGGVLIIGQQAFDAQRHIIDSSGRIEPRCDIKSDFGRRDISGHATRYLQQSPYARAHLILIDSRQALHYQDTIIMVQ